MFLFRSGMSQENSQKTPKKFKWILRAKIFWKLNTSEFQVSVTDIVYQRTAGPLGPVLKKF